MKFKLRIIFTNWVNLVGMAGAVFIWGIINSVFLMNNVRDAPPVLVFGILNGFFLMLYGALPIACFTCGIVILDTLLFNRSKAYLNTKLITEWLIISAHSPIGYQNTRNGRMQ